MCQGKVSLVGMDARRELNFMEQDMKNVFITLAIAVSLMGCGDPKIDGSDKQSFEKSVQAILESLPKEQRDGFRADLGIANLLAMKGLSTGDGVADINMQVLKSLHGKSASEIHQIANAERKVRNERAIADMSSQLASRQKLLDDAVAQDLEFRKVSLGRENYQVIGISKPEDRQKYFDHKLKFTVTNNSGCNIESGQLQLTFERSPENANVVDSQRVSFETDAPIGLGKSSAVESVIGRFEDPSPTYFGKLVAVAPLSYRCTEVNGQSAGLSPLTEETKKSYTDGVESAKKQLDELKSMKFE